MEKFYKVSESELKELLHDSMKLCALEMGGVDNWEWFEESISEFLKGNGEPWDGDIYDSAERELETYPEVD